MQGFFKNERGNVAMITGILILPLMLAAGVAIDYSGLSRKNSNLQNAVDSAVLAAAQKWNDVPLAKLQSEAELYLRANLSKEQFDEIKKIKLSRSDNDTKLTLWVSAEHPTSMMSIAGIDHMEYAPKATVGLPDGNFEVALVLDTTHSMSVDGKIDTLKTAASKFVTDLTAHNKLSDRVKIGIVPFAKYVNVGTDKRGAGWLDVPADSSENICYESTPVTSKSGCSKETRYRDGVPYQAEVCTSYTYGPPETVCYDSKKEWHGCVGSRHYPLNLKDTGYGVRVPGIQNATCSSKITSLTADTAKLKSAVSSLSPNGDTYIPAGLTWGLRTLSSSVPFTGGVTYANAKNTNTEKVLILMSDGENVRSPQIPDYPTHNGSDVDQANDYTLEACSEIKDHDIRLITIGFGKEITPATVAMLTQCSTGGNDYYSAEDNAALLGVFETISSELTRLYLSE